ncbi:MAG: hypothetical protein HYX66_01705 [Ignavibacteria bacterium]|nr:hypothetical protein [Ignavibacteria bacterium]
MICMFRVVPLWLIALIVASPCLNAQQQAPQPNAPLELPEFIITGKESVNIPGGVKQLPNRPPLLQAEKLDSINPLEKLPLPALRPRPLPTYSSAAPYWPGYIDAYVGNYLTPGFSAGYSFKRAGYMVDIYGDFEASNGWVRNADYSMFSLGASSSYVAPEKFIFFGGSTTEVDVSFSNKSYNLYSDSSAPSRSIAALKAGVGTEGRYNGVSYNASIAWKMSGVSTSNRSVSDNLIIGRISAANRWKSFDIGALFDLRLQTFDSKAYPFTSVAGTGRYITEDMNISVQSGFQWASATSAADRLGLEVRALANFKMSSDFTFTSSVHSGLRPISFTDLLRVNPYVSDSSVVDIPYDVFDVGASVIYHPSMLLSASVGITIRRSDRETVWVKSLRGEFMPEYRTVTGARTSAEFRWLVASSDALVGDIHFITSTVAGANQTPYIPSVESSLGYDRSWSQPLHTVASIVYYADRYADMANTITLGGYVDVRLAATYAVKAFVDINLSAENLFGNTIVLWEGYLERGVFVKAGLTWKF